MAAARADHAAVSVLRADLTVADCVRGSEAVDNLKYRGDAVVDGECRVDDGRQALPCAAVSVYRFGHAVDAVTDTTEAVP